MKKCDISLLRIEWKSKEYFWKEFFFGGVGGGGWELVLNCTVLSANYRPVHLGQLWLRKDSRLSTNQSVMLKCPWARYWTSKLPMNGCSICVAAYVWMAAPWYTVEYLVNEMLYLSPWAGWPLTSFTISVGNFSTPIQVSRQKCLCYQ